MKHFRLPVGRIAIFLGVMLLNLFITSQCLAKEVVVELVWKFGQTGWLNITIEQGQYEIITATYTGKFPEGSSLQVGWGGWAPVLRLKQEDYQLLRGATVQLTEISQGKGTLKITSQQGEQASYRGGLSLTWLGDHWKLINNLEEEDYLKGVVPVEMSNAWAKDGLEGLKAQAIAARTFMAKNLQNQKRLTDSPDIDQAYAGKAVEGSATAAVEATTGQILVDNQTLKTIDAFYSAHNGGYSEATENVWLNQDKHFSAHPDPFSRGVGGAADQWRFIASAQVIGQKFGLGPVKQIELDKFPSGRVKGVRLVDNTEKTRALTGREFVKAFYPFGQSISRFAFLGSLFEVSYTPTDHFKEFLSGSLKLPYPVQEQEMRGPLLGKIISSSQGSSPKVQPFGVFIFSGRGWGHGVGMSQWGAYHMAQLGYGYADILGFYYDNVVVVKR
ncbi:MAG: SpoIID/LytB domain-containing protein [Desulfitobacteriaceae bacterium]